MVSYAYATGRRLTIAVACLALTAAMAPGGELHGLVQSGDGPGVVRWLQANAARVDETDAAGRTALHVAAAAGRTELAAALLDAGALVDARDKRGNTPLHEAARADAREAVALLVKRGADVAAVDAEGRTAFALAVQQNARNAAELLASRTDAVYTDPTINKLFADGEGALESGDYERAYDVLNGLLREQPGSEKINFALGQTCMAMKDYPRARMAYERVLQINPLNDRARLELGRAHMALQQFDAAAAEFRAVLAKNPPETVRRNIELYLRTAEAGAKRWSVNARVDAGWFTDDNVNVGPDSTIVSIAPVLFGSIVIDSLAVDESSKPIEADGLFGSVNGTLDWDAGERGGWVGTFGGTYFENAMSDAEAFETRYYQALAGLRRMDPRSRTAVPLMYSQIDSGGEPLVGMLALAPSWVLLHPYDSRLTWTTAAMARMNDYDTLNDRDGTYLAVSETLRRVVSDRGHNFTMRLVLFTDMADSPEFENTGYQWQLGGELALPWRMTLYGRLGYTKTEYAEREVLAPEERKDTQNQFLVGWNARLGRRFGLDANIMNTDNNSSFALYQYERTVTTVGAYLQF